MTQTSTAKRPPFEQFADRQRELAAQGPQWLQRLRLDAAQRFEQLGLPTTRLEEWRATSIAAITRSVFRPAPPERGLTSLDGLPEAARLELGGPRLVVVDGRFVPSLSSEGDLGEGVWLGSLAEALKQIPERIEPHLLRSSVEQASAFEALNESLAEDGAVVIVPDGRELARPIQLLFVSTASSEPIASAPRALVLVGSNSRARVIETYTAHGEGRYLTNAVTDVEVGDNASLEHTRVQLEGPGGYHISHNRFRQGRDSRYAHCNINLGGRLVRNDLGALLDGEGGWCRLDGLYIVDGEQHLDNHTRLDHAQPHCDSRELYKGILAGSSRAIFNGRIIVRQDAQKTDAKQSNPNLLLSPAALANTRPQLEIYADDVKCTHGATIGRLDREAIFYLQSRGLSVAEARELMLVAFAGEVLETVEPEPLRESLARIVAGRLQAISGHAGRARS
jgi:Fe-S cluster assembly protein SufD